MNIRTEGNRGYIDMLSSPPLTALLAKLNSCLNQIEQFAVKVNDSPGGTSGNLQGLHALKFFHSHQIKVCFNSITYIFSWVTGRHVTG